MRSVKFLNCVYIEPISNCNLDCKMCYTDKSAGKIPPDVLKGWLEKYISYVEAIPGWQWDCLYWCGSGEVFLYRELPELYNWLRKSYPHIPHQLQTNGTLDRLDQFEDLKGTLIRVSVDGFKEEHDWNRGPTFDKIMEFSSLAHQRGAALEFRSLLTATNWEKMGDLEKFLKGKFPGCSLSANEIYSNKHMDSVRECGFLRRVVDDSRNIKPEDVIECKSRFEHLFLDSTTIFLYMALFPSGIYSCCEGMNKIGEYEASAKEIYDSFLDSVDFCNTCPLKGSC